MDSIIRSTFFTFHLSLMSFFFFFNDTATTEIYTLSLHDALPIYLGERFEHAPVGAHHGEVATDQAELPGGVTGSVATSPDRKSTRLNSSHLGISYAVFCLKKKKTELIPL